MGTTIIWNALNRDLRKHINGEIFKPQLKSNMRTLNCYLEKKQVLTLIKMMTMSTVIN